MRPDEHKKKKNAAYKKKHGISKPSSDDVLEKDRSDYKKNVVKQDRRNRPSPLVLKDKSKRDQALALPSSTSNDEYSSDTDVDSHHKAPAKKNFARREIVSNWQKYELVPDSENPATSARGEKYETLLNMAGEAMSRFRFRDELEWEDEQNNGLNVNSGPKDHSESCLVLNPSDLIESLACIPVHRLLEVDEELIPKEQLESILEKASKNRSAYSSKIPSCHKIKESAASTVILDKSVTVTQDNDGAPPSPKNDHKHHGVMPPAVASSSEPKTVTTDSDCDILLDESCESQTSSHKILTLQDDDLDRLLDMDLESDGKNSSSDCHQAHNSVSQTSQPPMDMVTADSASSGVKQDKNESEDLEDWLDSILD